MLALVIIVGAFMLEHEIQEGRVVEIPDGFVQTVEE